MRFSPQFLEELRARLAVSDVVGRRVKLKKSGSEWCGLSPFNQERTPSFFVNDAKMMWFDFSAGKNGTIFDFLMLTEGLSFPEAVERLAEQAGMALPKYSEAEARRDERRKTLIDILELAAKFFEVQLASRAGARARGYLADRGIDAATQLRFRLGYAGPERFALKEHLGKEGVPAEDMVEAGLLVAGEEIPLPYDRFRERVMFPIADLRHRVIAFGGRALEKDVPAKYLNSPETPLFHKGATLYNIASARAAAHKGAPLIAVEGYVDVIAMVQAGYEATLAPLGTALTAEQLLLLWRIADEPMLCFDGDEAGRRAAYRAVDLALPLLAPGKSLKFVSLPEGHDPDDLVRSGGRSAVEEIVAAARPLAHVLWTRETEAGSFETPERRAAFEARLAALVNAISDEAVRKYYRSEFGERLRGLFAGEGRGGVPARLRPRSRYERLPYGGAGLTGTAGRRGGFETRPYRRDAKSRGGAAAGFALAGDAPYVAASPQLAASPVHRGHRAAIPRREALILQAIINHPWLLHDHLEELAAIELRHGDAAKVKAAILDIFAHDGSHDRAHGDGSADDDSVEDDAAEHGAAEHGSGNDVVGAGLKPAPTTAPDAESILAELDRRGLGEVTERIGKAITTASVWGARAGAAPDDVLLTWKQLVALHRHWHSLARELKDAEHALGHDSTEANLAWLQDVKARLAVLDGTEALIEGFGISSNRPVRAF
ncbi:MAG TPA: DNA primase [Xanthobacteraceae bacterium]|jgi:DNA primase